MHGIALQGLLRMNRAMILSSLIPDHKIAAVAGSELISACVGGVNTTRNRLVFANPPRLVIIDFILSTDIFNHLYIVCENISKQFPF